MILVAKYLSKISTPSGIKLQKKISLDSTVSRVDRRMSNLVGHRYVHCGQASVQPVSDVPVARLPDEVMDMVFSILPTKDIKNVALVCRAWKSLTQHPKFWRKVLVKISRNDIEEKLQGDRLGLIGSIELVDDLPARQLQQSRREVVAVLQVIIEAGSRLELKHLNLCYEDLSSVQPELLAQAVVRVEEANLPFTKLRDIQVSTIFSRIVDTERLSLKRLSLLGEGERVSQVAPDLLAQAVIKLEDPERVLAGATEEQLLAVIDKLLILCQQ